MQVSLPFSNNFLMSPLVIFLISAFCFAASDVFACCVLFESHIHRAFTAAFSYDTSNSQLIAHKGAQVETINPSECKPLFTHIPCADFFWKWFPWGYTREMISRVGMEHMIKTKVLWEHCFGSLCALGCTKESRPCNAMVGAAQNCQSINQAVNWTEKDCVVFKLLLCRNTISRVQTVPLTDVFN